MYSLHLLKLNPALFRVIQNKNTWSKQNLYPGVHFSESTRQSFSFQLKINSITNFLYTFFFKLVVATIPVTRGSIARQYSLIVSILVTRDQLKLTVLGFRMMRTVSKCSSWNSDHSALRHLNTSDTHITKRLQNNHFHHHHRRPLWSSFQ